MQASDLITLTRNLLNDNVNYTTSSPGIESAQSFSPEMYLEACNWACKQYAIKTSATYTEVSATAATATSLLTIPLDNLNVVRVMTNQFFTPSVPYTLQVLQNGVPSWGALGAMAQVSPTSYLSASFPFSFSATITSPGAISSIDGGGYAPALGQSYIQVNYSDPNGDGTITISCDATVDGYSLHASNAFYVHQAV